MIMGAGVARTVPWTGSARAVEGLAGAKRTALVAMLSVPVGLVSGPDSEHRVGLRSYCGVLGIARAREDRGISLIKPIGFAAILGGTDQWARDRHPDKRTPARSTPGAEAFSA